MAVLHVKVSPGGKRDRLTGWLAHELKLQVRARPEKGRANDAVVQLFADTLHIPRDRIRIRTGHTSPRKQIEIEGLSDEDVRSRIQSTLDAQT
ncbi:MAG: hypothetical protein CMJ18_25205 [Phycisphaeraceae bacterium]|nr:hypothetical protein [Phycisphaeraceae bacterium]